MPSKRVRFCVVASLFNPGIVRRLADGAREAFYGHGVKRSLVDLVWVPGAFELPAAALKMAKSGRYRAVAAVGCILQGETPQFTFLSQAVFSGLALASVAGGIPVTSGVITARSARQALARSKKRGVNRGREAADAAWWMANAAWPKEI
ncbi:MAG: 6,7-dimethyl-8-ribityllumazine synthase [Candidatus Omnitrophica bacterium]|nr:6,7-dimethyl-8-ribityllumazine synthase [Candidatus Omnitrophota bacterium]